MMLRDCPVFTQTYSNVADFVPASNSAYVHAHTTTEERSSVVFDWPEGSGLIADVQITVQDLDSVTVVCGYLPDGSSPITLRALLRSPSQLKDIWKTIGLDAIYIDITGLNHYAWAPLLRSALEVVRQVNVTYIEPDSYKLSNKSIAGEFYDLSDRTLGILPIPQFASIAKKGSDRYVFIPMLGFEGARLIRVMEEVEPLDSDIYPIIGVPGFRPEFPFVTYQGNKRSIIDHRISSSVRYATANCPFSAYYVIDEIASEHPDELIKLAPIGTKPHALGAILYHMWSNRRVEIIYDHPVRKAGRTTGSSRLLVYHVSQFKCR